MAPVTGCFDSAPFLLLHGQGRQLLTSNLGHSKTLSRGMPLPKFVPEEWEVCSAVLVLEFLHYTYIAS